MKQNKKKKIWLALVVIAVIMAIILIIPAVNADSGFDSSYDAGSPSGSYGSTGDGSLDLIFTIIELLFYLPPWLSIPVLIGIVVCVILSVKSSEKKQRNNMKLNHSKEISLEQVNNILKDFEKEKFLQDRYQDYLDIQNAWMNFDYEKLRAKVTDELYNQYEMQLQTLKVKNEQNIMESFDYIDSIITGITEENNQITVTTELLVAFYDYITKDHQIVRGSKTKKIYIHYELAYVCNKTTPDICPNCGAKLTDKASQRCDYCGSMIAQVSKDWVLSKKEAKEQH